MILKVPLVVFFAMVLIAALIDSETLAIVAVAFAGGATVTYCCVAIDAGRRRR
jgi:hypothetical protein